MADIIVAGNTSGAITISAPLVAGSGTLTLPVATDTLVGKATTDTLTNKTLTTPTISSLSSASATALTLQSAGTTAITVDTSQNVGIGTASPRFKLSIGATTATSTATPDTIDLGGTYSSTAGANPKLRLFWDGTQSYGFGISGGQLEYIVPTSASHVWYGAGSERMRIDSNGNVMTGATSATFAGFTCKFSVTEGSAYTPFGINNNWAGVSASNAIIFARNGTQTGSIQVTGTTTSYVTSSDYRLKEAITPMTGALAKVAALKPVTYKWKLDGSDAEGFIAHELAEVVPQCVSGEKDAVDDEGKPKYQGTDTSFLVATLTAAIQELKAIIDTQAERIKALEAKP